MLPLGNISMVTVFYFVLSTDERWRFSLLFKARCFVFIISTLLLLLRLLYARLHLIFAALFAIALHEPNYTHSYNHPL